MINIKEPCHEKWDEFSPTEQGAFCSKCQIDVVDFSVKSNQEVLEFFKVHAGQKMCGRFSQTQINDFNIAFYEWEQQSHQTFQAKFTLTLLIVFGLTLFSCSTSKEIQQVKQSIEQTRVEIDTLNQTNLVELSADTDSIKVTRSNCNYDSLYSSPPISLKLDEIYTQGGFYVLPPTQLILDEYLVQCSHLLGMIAVPQEINLPEDKIVYNKVTSIKPDLNAHIQVNPSNSILTVHSKYSEKLIINMHNETGKLILPISQKIAKKGKNSFNLNFKGISSGKYYIVIASETKNKIIEVNI